MKNSCMAALLAAGLAASAQAQMTYGDSQNELFDNGFAHLDIVSVTVNHDASNIYLDVLLRGDVDATNWGKTCIGINTSGGVNSSGNGWGRNVDWAGQGIDYWVGSWADDGGSNFGGELRQMTDPAGGGNSLLAATYAGPGISGSATGNTISFTLSRALMGLTGNDTFTFDVLTTGGGADPGVDHLSRADQSTPGWGTTSVAGSFLSYTIPAPGAAGLLALAGLAASRRRR
jgi:hypothetical protein